MNTITMNKAKLLGVVTANRKLHRDAFLEAQEGYRKAIIGELELSLQAARENKRFSRTKLVNMQEPKDMTSKYDQTIGMLEDHTDPTVEITREEYRNYVLDQWNWTDTWLHSNRAYSEPGGNFHRYSQGKVEDE